jgi:hypothetical protein
MWLTGYDCDQELRDSKSFWKVNPALEDGLAMGTISY